MRRDDEYTTITQRLSCVTAGFVFTYAKGWFSHGVAHVVFFFNAEGSHSESMCVFVQIIL